MRPHVGELLRKAQLREWALLFFLATALSVLSEAEVPGMARGSCCACLRPFASFWWKAAPAGCGGAGAVPAAAQTAEMQLCSCNSLL